MTAPQVSVVLPAYNEAELLQQAVSEITKGLAQRGEIYELLIVENGSTDSSPEIARTLAVSLPGVRSINLERADYGRAIAAGFASATADVVVLFDVDYWDLGFFAEAVDLVRSGRAGIVLASKRAPGAEDERPPLRRLLTAGFTAAMRLLLELPVTDAHGMKAVSKSAVAPLLSQSSMGGSLFDVELVLRASRAGVTIVELPARVSERRPPRTPVLRRSFEAAFGLVQLRFLMAKRRQDPPT